MGQGYTGRCRSCGHEAEVHIGGGFFFHMLHCDQCGKTKTIDFRALGDTHLTLSKKDRPREVEKLAGQCSCGGRFSMTAPPRCPKCRSTDIEDTGHGMIDYD